MDRWVHAYILCVDVCVHVSDILLRSLPQVSPYLLISVAFRLAFNEPNFPCRYSYYCTFYRLFNGHFHFQASQTRSTCTYLLQLGLHISLGKGKCSPPACLLQEYIHTYTLHLSTVLILFHKKVKFIWWDTLIVHAVQGLWVTKVKTPVAEKASV